jgi:adenylate cyclase
MQSPGSERRLAAIMFTDMVGYSALAQTNETLAMELLEGHRKLIRPILPRYGGNEIKTMGDGSLVEFQSALEALNCAIEMQRHVHGENQMAPSEKRTKLRIGIHVGDVIHRGGDIFGDAVNIASRILPLATDGGICISGQVYDQVRNKTESPLAKLEPMSLKNISLPIEVYNVVMPWEMTPMEPRTKLDPRRLAVLPLRNMSPDPNDEYFADGMTEELITSLAGISELTVIARTSVMQYKTIMKKVTEIGRELNVGSLIEGSVRKAGNKLRITVQLVNAQDDGHIWTGSSTTSSRSRAR